MKVTSVETFVVRALAGPWVFCAVRTDEGVTGYSEVGSGPNPRGVVKWTGVRFADLADLLEVQPFAHYCRIVASDGYWIEEGIETMRHPQVMLA